MQIIRKCAIATAATLILGGCASSGGRSEGTVTLADGTTQPITLGELFACIVTAFLACPTQSDNSNASSSTAASPVLQTPHMRFASWSVLPRDQDAVADAVSAGLSWARTPAEGTSATGFREHGQVFRYDSQGELDSIGVFSAADKRATLASLGHAGIDVRYQVPQAGVAQSPFTSLPAANVGAIANAYDLGWNYQSFGVWTNAGYAGNNLSAVSFGAPTPATSVPTAGSATFSGKLAGLYVSSTGTGYTAAANLSVQANFASRTLSVASSSTTLSRDFVSGTAAPHLNLSGTLGYAAGSGRFSGTLTNAGGTMSGATQGRFYGPAAQELGGAFTLTSPTTVESFSGAYGAKR